MSKHHLLSPLLNSNVSIQSRELVGLMEFSHYAIILKWGDYSPPHPIFLVLNKFNIWMLQNILLPLHQVFLDCFAPQYSLPCL